MASLWQQQLQQDKSAPTAPLLLQALKLCVAAGSKAAAAAAETLVGLLLQQQDDAASLQEGELCVQLVQLLCLHGRAATALQLLPLCLSSSTEVPSAGRAGAVAAAAAAVVDSSSSEQQQNLLQLLAGSGKQAVVQGALSEAVKKPVPPAAVGLLLNALQRSSPNQRLGQLLTGEQLEQLCRLVCGSASSTNSSSGGSSSPTPLPGVYQFSQECLAAAALPASAAAQLVNALCRQHPELQPSVAAAHLGWCRFAVGSHIWQDCPLQLLPTQHSSR